MEYLLPDNFTKNKYYNNDDTKKINKEFIEDEYSHITEYINNIVIKYLPNMVLNEQKKISAYTTIILIFISYKQNIEIDDFIDQIIMNNNRNIISIINMLLPYIDDKNDYEIHKNIKSITDLIEKKKKTQMLGENNAVYCNYIYDHNIQDNMERKIDKETGDTIRITDYKHKMKRYDKGKDTDLSYIYDRLLYFILDTVQKTGYKLYINWINIFPIGSNWRESKVYKKSFKYNKKKDLLLDYNDTPLCWFRVYDTLDKDKEKEINYINENIIKYNIFETVTGEKITGEKYYDISSKDMFKYSGIQVNDIYNTLVNDYFSSIKKQKWLLFEFKDDNINILISILHKIFNLNNIFNQKNWDELSLTYQDQFSSNMKKFFSSIKSNTGLLNISKDILKKTFITLISRFCVNYIYIIKLKNDDIIGDIDDSHLVKDDIEYDNKGLEYIDEYIVAVGNLDAEYIYEYLITEIGHILNTPYKNILFDDDKENNIIKLKEQIIKIKNVNQNNLNPVKKIYITPKNYYNYGKALSFDEGNVNREELEEEDNTNRLSYLWDGLSIRQKDLVCLRLNTGENNQDWFKITQILIKIYGYDKSKAEEINNKIYSHIRENVIELTFSNLVLKGCISEFKHNPNVSDEKILTDDYNTKKNILDKNMRKDSLSDDDNDFYEKKCYYFINNKKYGELDKITRTLKNTTKVESLSYFEHLREVKKRGDIWYTFYTMDWICQIDFFNKFFNHRVLYVTGSTGQGKSTQVPKLVLYGLKAFYYKNSGKAICTQPRVAPTTENIERISSSMGVSIKNYDEHYKEDIRTLNGNIQYKHANDSHIDTNSNYYLRMVTDGTLLVEMKNSPTLKATNKHEDDKKNDKNIQITEENIYDIIMVDESHEHNVNMDIILSLARNTLLYNNDLKLIIISATMDDDEPNYRSYYRYIDDNLSFPIDINTLQLGMSKNLIDRRFHISPPGKTTQFVVNDHFENSSIDTYKNNEGLGIDKCQEIFSSTSEGDILFFSTTRKKIISICNKLNKKIPINCICLPYFANMPNNYFKLVTSIDSKIKDITIDKKDLVAVFTGDKKEEYAMKVNSGTYKRAIIVATNVAEASLTISSLRYIVDLGYSLSVKYDYESKISSPLEVKISDSSRMQRRGRVGRVAGGDVYYMYPEKSRKYVKAEYDISIQNFAEQFLGLLAEKEEKEKEIINTEILNKLLRFENITDDEMKELTSYEKIIYKQYSLKLNSLDDDLLDLDSIKDRMDTSLLKNFVEWVLPSYKGGISKKCLLDTCGQFHLIHPFENKFIREPLTRNTLNDEGMVEFIPLEESHFMIEKALLDLDLINLNNNKLDPYSFYKTELSVQTDDFMQKLGIYDMPYTKSILISYILNVFDDLIFCNTCLKEDGPVVGKIESIIELGNAGKSATYRNFFKKNKQKNSDMELFLYLGRYIQKLINYDELCKLLYENKKRNEIFTLLRSDNVTYTEIINVCIKNYISIDNLNKILKLKLDGKLDEKSIKREEDENPDKEIIREFIKNIPNLKQLIKHKGMNLQIVEDIIYEYLSQKIKFSDKLEKHKKKIDEFRKILRIKNLDLNLNDKITLCYLLPNLNRLVSYRNKKLYIKNIFNSELSQERSIRDFFGLPLTLLNNISPIVLQLNDDGMGNEIKHGMLINIKKEMILEYIPHMVIIYNLFNDNYINKTDYINNIDYILKKINLQKENEDKDYNNMYYNIMIDEIKKIDQKGGQAFGNSHVHTGQAFGNSHVHTGQAFGNSHVHTGQAFGSLIKMKIDTLKKIKKLYDTLEDQLKNKIDNFDFVYIHFVGLNIFGLHLIKKDTNYIQIFSTININNSLDYLRNQITQKGNIVVGIDMSGFISNKDQKIIDFVLKN